MNFNHRARSTIRFLPALFILFLSISSFAQSPSEIEPCSEKSNQSLTARQLRRIFENKDNEDLLVFTRGLYQLLEKTNPCRLVNDREIANRRLDAFADLLVGDETCAAVAFDGKHLLIATNESTHEKRKIEYRLDVRFNYDPYIAYSIDQDGKQIFDTMPDEYSHRTFLASHPNWVPLDRSSCFICELQLNVTFNETEAMQKYFYEIPSKMVLEGYYDKNYFLKHIKQKLLLSTDRVKFAIPSEKHKIPNLPYDIDLIYELENNLGMPLGALIEKDKTYRGYKCITHVNPLKRRVNKILDHLSLVICANRVDYEFRVEALQAVEKNRVEILSQSLIWEIMEKDKSRREYANPKQQLFRENLTNFIQQLYENFVSFKKGRMSHNIEATELVNDWWAEAAKEIEQHKIKKPGFESKNGYETFKKLIRRYFINLEKLESYVIDDDKNGGKLAELLFASNPHKEKTWITILDGNEEKLHAEIRVLLHLLEAKKPIPYIATSKLCCCHCNLVMEQFGLGGKISGRSGSMFANWVLSRKLAENEDFLRRLFGKELFKKYDEFKGKKIKLPEHGKDSNGVTKKEVALRIFQSLASIGTDDLKRFKIADKKLDCGGFLHRKDKKELKSEKEPSKIEQNLSSRSSSELENRHWYDDDEINELLQHYVGINVGNGLMAALSLTQREGATVAENLRDREGQLRELELLTRSHASAIILPINLGTFNPNGEGYAGNHWTALHIHRPDSMVADSTPIITYVDPFGHPIPEALEQILRRQYPTAEIINPEIRFQNDGYNCGPWIVEILRHLVENNGSISAQNFVNNINAVRAAQQSHLASAQASGPIETIERSGQNLANTTVVKESETTNAITTIDLKKMITPSSNLQW